MGCFCFFFSSRRRHTRCGRDWSSDVCSSDLEHRGELRRRDPRHERVAVRPVGVEPRDIRQYHQLDGAERDGDGCRSRVRIDVEYLPRHLTIGCDGGYDGDLARVEEGVEHGGIDIDDLTDEPEIDLFPVDDRAAPTADRKSTRLNS